MWSWHTCRAGWLLLLLAVGFFASEEEVRSGGCVAPLLALLALLSAASGRNWPELQLSSNGSVYSNKHSGKKKTKEVWDHPDLEQIDPAMLKYCHAAAATCIVEAGKQKADKPAISTYLEDCKFDRERIEQFCTEYQKNKDNLEILLGSTGRCPPHITDICWRLEYQIKTNQLHKNYHPTYLMTLNVENNDSRSHQDINFSCSMEQLQDLIGKLKDAAKSLERTTQQ
ncbi:COMM domain-containing protein 3 isoform X1 [Sceloporus undulatus]|uniref:COMM domain-containing protein 3 isoform X1 n=1 Tax=Sceloporus undulatus TaxID=8520 RepID=UPI001C4B950A|nr:COMM domain-containing protein 3 isoform X1 [Sceloporus undulatus]